MTTRYDKTPVSSIRRCFRLSLALVLSCVTLPTDADAQQIDIVGTRFQVTLPGGRVLSQSELIGAMLNVSDADGNPLEIRIDGAQPDPDDESGEIYLYALKVRDAQSGSWHDMCRSDANGLSRGFPYLDPSAPNGGTLQFTCTSGAIGKCIRMGYKPWHTDASGQSLRDHHQACVRMIRADYCGNGQSHTRNGTVINIFDKLGIQDPAPEPASFEAAWGPDGALCVRKTRLPDLLTLDELVESCPDRLEGRTGAACSEAEALNDSQALILNRS